MTVRKSQTKEGKPAQIILHCAYMYALCQCMFTSYVHLHTYTDIYMLKYHMYVYAKTCTCIICLYSAPMLQLVGVDCNSWASGRHLHGSAVQLALGGVGAGRRHVGLGRASETNASVRICICVQQNTVCV